MSTTAGDIAGTYSLLAAKRDRVEMEARATITGGSGAVVSPLTAQDDAGITITRGGSAGLYLLTFPLSADTLGALDVLIISPAGTVKGWYCTAFAPNSGTASIQFINASGTATDPAAADSFVIQLLLSRRRDF